MDEAELYVILNAWCQYIDICSESDYGGRWECQHDKLACPHYFVNAKTELRLLEEFGLLEKKIVVYLKPEGEVIDEDP